MSTSKIWIQVKQAATPCSGLMMMQCLLNMPRPAATLFLRWLAFGIQMALVLHAFATIILFAFVRFLSLSSRLLYIYRCRLRTIVFSFCFSSFNLSQSCLSHYYLFFSRTIYQIARLLFDFFSLAYRIFVLVRCSIIITLPRMTVKIKRAIVLATTANDTINSFPCLRLNLRHNSHSFQFNSIIKCLAVLLLWV